MREVFAASMVIVAVFDASVGGELLLRAESRGSCGYGGPVWQLAWRDGWCREGTVVWGYSSRRRERAVRGVRRWICGLELIRDDGLRQALVLLGCHERRESRCARTSWMRRASVKSGWTSPVTTSDGLEQRDSKGWCSGLDGGERPDWQLSLANGTAWPTRDTPHSDCDMRHISYPSHAFALRSLLSQRMP